MKKMMFLLSLTMFLSGYAAEAESTANVTVTFSLNFPNKETIVLSSKSSAQDLKSLIQKIDELAESQNQSGLKMVQIKASGPRFFHTLVDKNSDLLPENKELFLPAKRLAGGGFYVTGTVQDFVRKIAKKLDIFMDQ